MFVVMLSLALDECLNASIGAAISRRPSGKLLVSTVNAMGSCWYSTKPGHTLSRLFDVSLYQVSYPLRLALVIPHLRSSCSVTT